MDAENLTRLFRSCMPLFIALGDEVRLTIIEALARTGLYNDAGGDIAVALDGYSPRGRPGMNVNEITERTSLSRPAVSHHLKILKDAGLIAAHREGTCNYYYLTIEASTRQLRSLGGYLQELFQRVESQRPDSVFTEPLEFHE